MKIPHSTSLLLIVLPILLLSISCRPNIQDFDQVNLLVDKEWLQVSIEQDNVEVSDTCDLDDVFRFSVNSDFSHEEGVLQCNPADDLKITGTSWQFNRGFESIRLRYQIRGNSRGTLIRVWRIIELTDSSLILEEEVDPDDANAIPEIRRFSP